MAAKKFMDENNGHDKRLVTYINHVCSIPERLKLVTIILRAICERDSDECLQKLGFIPYHDRDIEEARWDILTNICDDIDLITIIHFCGYAV